MADKVTETNYLQIEFGFSDSDYRKQNLKNPKANLTESQVQAVNDWIVNNRAVIGDKFGADTTGINSAVIIENRKTVLDLES